jgi:hypothetical protein
MIRRGVLVHTDTLPPLRQPSAATAPRRLQRYPPPEASLFR